MNVSELIRQLRLLPPAASVLIEDDCGEQHEASKLTYRQDGAAVLHVHEFPVDEKATG